ncbi:MAG: 30S ribosomal protein S16 [Planctomycetota bacterium]
MPLIIRMSMKGRTNRPFFRVGVYDALTRRDGPPVEYLGWYDPKMVAQDKQFVVDLERVQHWIGKGAKVSDTIRSYLKRAGVKVPTKPTARVRKAKVAARKAAAKKG